MTSWQEREQAAERLAALDPSPEVADALVALMSGGEDTAPPMAAAALLLDRGDRYGVEVFLRALAYVDDDRFEHLMLMVDGTRHPHLFPMAVVCGRDGGPELRQAAAELLDFHGVPIKEQRAGAYAFDLHGELLPVPEDWIAELAEGSSSPHPGAVPPDRENP